jgi:tRNA dimethylallyltransferase
MVPRQHAFCVLIVRNIFNITSVLETQNSSLVAIVGATGAGKSALAVAMAQHFEGEIVNFDSVQVYRGLDIGSAKTPVAERGGIAHHLIDIAEPEEELTAGSFAALARGCLREIAGRGRLPVLVGGTGFYLRSLLDGLSPAPGRDAELRRRLGEVRGRRPGALHRWLRRFDAAAAARIHANDHQKLMRAIELAAQQTEALPREPLVGFQVLRIGLNPPRVDLYRKINARSTAMFDGGLLEEVRRLLDSGVAADAKGLQTLGYRQAVAVLQGRMSATDAREEVQQKTRQYAKRQMTWFRREDVTWLDGFGDELAVQEAAVALIAEFF